MGILKKMFGQIDPQKLLDGVGGFIDESNLSKEETVRNIIEHFKISLNESTPRSVTRRFIALAFVGSFLLFLFGAAVAWPFNVEYAKFLFDIAKYEFSLVVTVTIFYFGGYYGQKFYKTRRERKLEVKEKEKELEKN